MQALLASIATATSSPDARRLFHGRGGRFAGEEAWTLDILPPVALLTSFRPASDDELARVGAALAARWPLLMPGAPLCWVHQWRHEGRAETRTMAGSVPDPHVVSEAGARYRLHLLRGQNHGLFLDMAEGRRWVRQAAAAQPGMKVLNLFAYTCAFSVVALQAGAGSVVNLDMAAGALASGRENHRLNGVEAGARFLAHDVFHSWAQSAARACSAGLAPGVLSAMAGASQRQARSVCKASVVCARSSAARAAWRAAAGSTAAASRASCSRAPNSAPCNWPWRACCATRPSWSIAAFGSRSRACSVPTINPSSGQPSPCTRAAASASKVAMASPWRGPSRLLTRASNTSQRTA